MEISINAKPRYRKRAIPGHVKVTVARRLGATPDGRNPVNCFYCGAEGELWWPLTFTGKVGCHMAMDGFEFDHIYPEFRGGKSVPWNIVIACRPCNRAKRDKVMKCLESGLLSLSSGIAPEQQPHRCARDCFS